MWSSLFRKCLALIAGLLLVSCGGDGASERLSKVGETCSKIGDCEAGLVCLSSMCQVAGADCPGDKDCSGVECGPDPVCEESCGSCDSDKTCLDGQCVALGSEDTYSPPTGGTWKDPTSGLTWQASPPMEYDTRGEAKSYTWGEAKSYCDSLSLGGHSDWYLPTIGELRSLIRGCPATESGGSCNIEEGDCLMWSCWDDSCSGCAGGDGPAEGGMYWPDEIEGDYCWYWSSSFVGGFDNHAWGVGFDYGSVTDGWVNIYVNTDYHVRCVR